MRTTANKEMFTFYMSLLADNLSDKEQKKAPIPDIEVMMNTLISAFKKTLFETDASDALEIFLRKPDSWARQEVLTEELTSLDKSKQEEVLKLFLEFSDLIKYKQKESDSISGKYNITISSSTGLVIGDANSVTQSFVEKGKKKK